MHSARSQFLSILGRRDAELEEDTEMTFPKLITSEGATMSKKKTKPSKQTDEVEIGYAIVWDGTYSYVCMAKKRDDDNWIECSSHFPSMFCDTEVYDTFPEAKAVLIEDHQMRIRDWREALAEVRATRHSTVKRRAGNE